MRNLDSQSKNSQTNPSSILGIDSSSRTALACAVFILVLAAIARVLPHTANVTPFMAAAMLVGFILGNRSRARTAALVVGAMVMSDLAVGLHWTAPFVYVGMVGAAWLGGSLDSFLNQNVSGRLKSLIAAVGGAMGTSAVASLFFFVISNFGVWLVGELYPISLAGLTECFVLAIPFFKNSFAVDLIFGTSFLLVASVVKRQAKLAQSKIAIAATQRS